MVFKSFTYNYVRSFTANMLKNIIFNTAKSRQPCYVAAGESPYLKNPTHAHVV